MIQQEIRLLLTAVQYFTRLPVPAWIGHGPGQLNQAARYFPAVGLLVGGVAALVLWLAALVAPLPIAVLLSMMASILLTGGFHEDGLADSCDGFGGGWQREDVLRIMKDSRLGSFGALGLFLVLGLKAALLMTLPLAWLPVILVAAHSYSRWLPMLLIWRLDYVRDEDAAKAKPMVQAMAPASLIIGALCGILPAVLLLHDLAQPGLLLGLLPSLALAVLLGLYCRKRIGGYTGDTLGAVQQLTEIMFYFGCGLILWHSSGIAAG